MTRAIIPVLLLLAALSVSFRETPPSDPVYEPREWVFQEDAESGNRLLLLHDHGLVIRNIGTYDKPVPLFQLAHRGSPGFVECRTHAELALFLDRFPSGVKWVRYEKCQAPFSAGISKEWLEEAMALFSERQQSVESDEFIFCTCL